jgi:hypothetical protein
VYLQNHRIVSGLLFSACALSVLPAADAQSQEDLEARIQRLEQMNSQLLTQMQTLIAIQEYKADPIQRLPNQQSPRVAGVPEPVAPPAKLAQQPLLKSDLVSVDPEYGYDILDHAETTNRKRIVQLRGRMGSGRKTKITVSGGTTVLANYQKSNSDSKFGYLMRHPTSANQIGTEVSEAVVHSAQLAVTADFTDYLTGYLEFLYNPQQSFGSGTITDLNRNQVQVRKAYLMFGDLERSPIYAAIGKMDTPFGLNDTVSPFTNSTSWHAFAGLAYGAELGYYKDGLSLRAMAIQGGSQFRAANTPVNGTNVPSKLNNFALDASYEYEWGETSSALIGASYLHGSPYCSDYPVFHFDPCDDENPAAAIYGQIDLGSLRVLGEYAQTLDEWPGSAVPDPTNPLSVFEAQKTSAFTLGARYGFGGEVSEDKDRSAFSLEYSEFVAGDEGAPWERQNQWVAGYSAFLTPSVNLFGEVVRAEGFVPLNFLSGGNFPDGSTWSERDATTDVILIGAQAAF